MAIDKVRAYFRSLNMEDKVLEFDASSATVELAAKALNTEPKRIAKTLSFLVGDQPVLIVAAGDARVDNHGFKDFFHKKPKMIPADRVEELIGHQIGGVCPFAINPGIDVYLDESLKRFETTFAACGSASSAIELSADELEKYSSAKGWVDVCKSWREEQAS